MQEPLRVATALIAWTPIEAVGSPTRGQVRVGPLSYADDDSDDWSYPYMMTSGAAWTAVRKLHGKAALRQLRRDFNYIVKCGVPFRVVQAEFMKIAEYRDLVMRSKEALEYRGMLGIPPVPLFAGKPSKAATGTQPTF
ncbi:MAG: hypothetical protein WBX25_34855 [Rhodomicrobium sp.]